MKLAQVLSRKMIISIWNYRFVILFHWNELGAWPVCFVCVTYSYWLQEKNIFKNKIWMVEGLEAVLVPIINDAETLQDLEPRRIVR